MNLLILGSGSYLSPLSIRIRALAKHLSIQWNVTVIVPGADKYNNFITNKKKDFPGVRLIQPWQFTTKNANLNLLPYLVTSFFAAIFSKSDAVYLYKPTPITILGLLVGRLRGVPVILDMDDLGSEVMRLEKQSAFNYRLVATCESLAIKYSSAVVVTSTYLETLIKAKYPAKKILILANGVEPSDYNILVEEPRNNIYYFGVISRLSIIESIIKAMPEILKSVPNTKLTIAGGSGGGINSNALDEARELAKKLGVIDSIEFTGWISNMLDVAKYVKYADLAVCCQPDTPTVRASSNMKVFQYMAMRSVLIVNNVGDQHLYVKEGQAGALVPPGDIHALAETAVKLLKDNGMRRTIAENGYNLAQTEYSWEQLALRLNKFIYSILNIKSAKQ